MNVRCGSQAFEDFKLKKREKKNILLNGKLLIELLSLCVFLRVYNFALGIIMCYLFGGDKVNCDGNAGYTWCY